MPWSAAAGLPGKVAVVSGAAGAIGAEVALAFAAAGTHVLAVDVDADGLADLMPMLDGGPHASQTLDLRQLDEHERLLRGAVSSLGGLDILANVAGVLIRRADLDEVTEEDWDYQHDINLKASFFLNRAAARIMRERGAGGRIINFSSQGWWSGGFGGSVVYAATKGGIVSMTRGLARSYAPDAITVNAVSPGAVDSPMLRGGLTEEQLETQLTQIPIGYMAEPGDLTGAVLFLASDHARYITGATINVSGGWLMY